MSVSETQKRASKKYILEKCDELKVRLPKGKKEIVKAHAAKSGESVNGFVIRAIDEAMERESDKSQTKSQT